jgi:phosphate transport system permease protein
MLHRSKGKVLREGLIEWLIRICGISAVVFVFAIFFFVFWEAKGLVFSGKININTASADALAQIEGVDQNLAEKIVTSRAEIDPEKRHTIGWLLKEQVLNEDQFFLIESHIKAKEFSFWKFLTTEEWYPASENNPRYGVFALIAGTISVTILSMFIAVPFGLGSALFISEFCTPKLKETLKIVIELLAAIPSVVWGFIGLTIMNQLIMQIWDEDIGITALNGAIILGLMSVPIIVSIGEDALQAVPDSYREAAIGLGVTRWQLVYKVLLPAAKNGLLAAVLLGVGRAIGETMAVLLATGHSVNNPFNGEFPFLHALESVKTLTATIAAEMGEAPRDSDHYQVLFTIGILLFTLTFAVNLTADLIVKGIRNK